MSAAFGAGLKTLADNLDTLIPAIAAVGTVLTVGYIARTVAAASATAGLGASMLAAFGGPVGLAVSALALTIGYVTVASNAALAETEKLNQGIDAQTAKFALVGDAHARAAAETDNLSRAERVALTHTASLTGEANKLATAWGRVAAQAKSAAIAQAQADLDIANGNTRKAQQALTDKKTSTTAFVQQTSVGAYGVGGMSLESAPRIARETSGAEKQTLARAQENQRSAQAALQEAQSRRLATFREDSGAVSDPKTIKALAGLKTKLDGLETLAGGATGKRLDRIKSQIEVTKRKIDDIGQGASPAAANAAEGGGGTGRTRRGPSAETLAHRAEAARVRDVHDDESYTTALKQAHDQELQASIDLSNDAVKRAALERDRVRDAAVETAKNIRAKGPKDAKANDGVAGTGERTADETNNLLGINSRTADLRVDAIDLAERRGQADDAASLSRAEIDVRRDALHSREQENLTVAERQRVALQLLDLDYQLKEADLRAVLAADSKATKAERDVATVQLRDLPSRKSADERDTKRQYQGTGKSYLEGLKLDKPQFIQSEEVKTLDEFNRGLDETIAKTLHLHGVFGTIIGDLIDMAVKQALIKPLAGALFGGGASGGGGGGGGLGGLFGSVLGALGGIGGGGASVAATNAAAFSLPGFGGARAAGGPVSPGKAYLVGENGPEIATFGNQGTIIPNHAINVAASNRSVRAPQQNVTVLQPIHADFSGARTDEQTMRQFQQYADARSKQAYDAAVATSGSQVSGIVQRKQTLGN